MTNLEHIQSMGASEMAEFLTYGGFDCKNCMTNERCPCDQECYTHCLEWLEREVEE